MDLKDDDTALIADTSLPEKVERQKKQDASTSWKDIDLEAEKVNLPSITCTTSQESLDPLQLPPVVTDASHSAANKGRRRPKTLSRSSSVESLDVLQVPVFKTKPALKAHLPKPVARSTRQSTRLTRLPTHSAMTLNQNVRKRGKDYPDSPVTPSRQPPPHKKSFQGWHSPLPQPKFVSHPTQPQS